MCRKTMNVQVEVLGRIQCQRHGLPKSTKCYWEYDNAQFRAFCAEIVTILNLVVSNDHESNAQLKMRTKCFVHSTIKFANTTSVAQTG